MKATNNSTNTLFMEIFVELLEIARTYFQELFKNEKPGVYTLKDVYAYIANCKSLETKQGKAERLTEKEKEQVTKILHKSPYYSNIDSFFINSVSYVCKVSNNIVSIEKDNFKCSFDIVKVFEYLERFKQLSGAKEKLEFVKEGNQVQESEDNCICSFDIIFNKKDKTFLTVKTKNSSRYIDNNILIDINLSKIYATNAFICKSRNVKISNLFGDWDKHICISFDTFKKLVGKECHIIVNSDDKEEQTVVTIVTDKGEMFECSYYDSDKNVNIESVYPILYKELKLTVKDDKQFTKDLKTISKVSEFVSFEIEKGSDRLRVNYITELGISDTENKYGELFVQLSEPSNFSYRSDNRLSKVLSCLDGWNGEIYFTKEYSYCKLSFVSDNCDNCFMIDNKINYFNSIRDKNDYFPDKLTSVYCGKETKEPDTDIKPVGTSENKNDTNLQESKESATNKVFFFMEKDGYHWEQPNAQTFHLFKNGKEKVFKNEFEAYNFVQNKENESYFDFNVSDYTDDMLEVTGLNLESIISKVKQDSPKELKVIQDIKLYDKTGKIVFTYDNGSIDTVVEATFNGDSVLQSVLQKINESM